VWRFLDAAEALLGGAAANSKMEVIVVWFPI
jgi:hypothetical protein